MALLPTGVPGELYLAGEGVARGYLNRPELTSEKFRPQIAPINKSFAGVQGGVFYKTGDLARWLSDGNIEFLGRVDHQVKIRGYRIELGEIEDKLTGFEGIRQAVVLAKETQPGAKELVAYIVSTNQIALRTLKDYLEKHLPGYMIPSYFHFLEQIPLLLNGKIDRKTLETYDLKLSLEAEYTPPESDVEKTIAGAWKEVLNLESIGIHNNFFDVGGNSLKIIQLNARLKETFQKDIPVTALFEHTTIHSQAKFIQPGAVQDNPPDREQDRTEEINQGKTRLAQRMQRRGEVTDD
jgi:acyl carrier protein